MFYVLSSVKYKMCFIINKTLSVSSPTFVFFDYIWNNNLLPAFNILFCLFFVSYSRVYILKWIANGFRQGYSVFYYCSHFILE